MSAANSSIAEASEATSTRQRNVESLRRIIEEGFNQGDLAVVDELVDPGFEEHQFFGPHHPSGPAGLKAVILDCRRMFPDFHMTFEDISTNEDTVWARLRATGTHVGEILGRPPTGKRIAIDVMELGRFRDGKLVEHWGIPDRFHMLFQIGVLGGPPARP